MMQERDIILFEIIVKNRKRACDRYTATGLSYGQKNRFVG